MLNKSHLGKKVDPAGTDNSTDVTLHSSATDGGLTISTQEISNRAATNAQTGYATAAQITALEAKIANLLEDTTPQLGGDLEYNEKHQVFKVTLTADDRASGDIITVTFGETVAFGQLVYPDADDNEFKLALGTNAGTTMPALGVALEAKNDGESGKMLLRGTIRDATFFSGFAMGDMLFVSDGTPGSWVNSQPTDAGDIIQPVGWMIAANYAFFAPDYTWVELG